MTTNVFAPEPSGVHSETVMLDQVQLQIAQLPAQTSFAVLGAPGTGKTSTLIVRFCELLNHGLTASQLLAVTPSRSTASALRVDLALEAEVSSNRALAHSLAAIAFEISASDYAASENQPLRLLSGAEEDRIIKQLLSDLSQKESGFEWSASFSAELIESASFRSQLRAAIYFCIEQNLSTDQLRAYAREHSQQVWSNLADFLPLYLERCKDVAPNQKNIASILSRAVRLLNSPGYRMPADLDKIRVLLCDDIQACSPGELDLIAAFKARGVAINVFVDPDSGISNFRGSNSSQIRELVASLAHKFYLPNSYRSRAGLRIMLSNVLDRIGVSGFIEQRGAVLNNDFDIDQESPANIHTFELSSELDESLQIAKLLRKAHILDGVPWRECAVIAHDSRYLQQLAVELSSSDIPVYLEGQAQLLSERGAARDLLNLLAYALELDTDARPNERMTSNVLRGRFCGLDIHSQRVLRRRLATEIEIEPNISPRAQLNQALLDEVFAESLCERFPYEAGFRKLFACAKIISMVRSAEVGATAQELLWMAWESSQKAEHWREQAMRQDSSSARANEDLDAVLALFEAAKRFDEGALNESGRVFIAKMLDQTIADDQLDAQQRYESVSLLTPEASLAREFDTVVIAAVQKGVWPNLKPRGELFANAQLAAVVSGEEYLSDDQANRLETRHGELRLLLRSISRAKRQLFVTSVSNEDSVPSSFFRMFPEPEKVEEVLAFDLPTAVGQLRRSLSDPHSSEAAKELAAQQLALLASSDVRGADPKQWYGLSQASSSEPFWYESELKVSPSQLMSFKNCPLDWAVSSVSGPGAQTSSALAYGTIIHALLENFLAVKPNAQTFEEIHTFLKDSWDSQREQLPKQAPWLAQAQEALAQRQLIALASYLRSVSGEIIASETEFEVQIGLSSVGDLADREVHLRGKIDLIERGSDGEITIIDLKTGTSSGVTDKAVLDNLQLRSYQLAAACGALPGISPPIEAALLVLRDGTVKNDISMPRQPALSPAQLEEFQNQVLETVEEMSASSFPYDDHAHCSDANSRGSGSCRIHAIEYISEA